MRVARRFIAPQSHGTNKNGVYPDKSIAPAVSPVMLRGYEAGVVGVGNSTAGRAA